MQIHRTEIVAKVVFEGPAHAGKRTSIEVVQAKTPEPTQLEMIKTESPTLALTVPAPGLRKLDGRRIRFDLQTVPGVGPEDPARRLALQSADGIVFVADSQADRLDDNLAALQACRACLPEHGLDFETIPMACLWNKRDLSDLTDVETLERELNARSCPSFEGVATSGTGVLQALRAIADQVWEQLTRW